MRKLRGRLAGLAAYLDARTPAATSGASAGPPPASDDAARSAGLNVLDALRPSAPGPGLGEAPAPPRRAPRTWRGAFPAAPTRRSPTSPRTPGRGDPRPGDAGPHGRRDRDPRRRRAPRRVCGSEPAAQAGRYQDSPAGGLLPGRRPIRSFKAPRRSSPSRPTSSATCGTRSSTPRPSPRTLGLLMEHRANLYEVAIYLDRHPDAARLPPPANFYDAELWFKTRLYAGSVDQAMADSLAGDGWTAGMRTRALQILGACRRPPCGGNPGPLRMDRGSNLREEP